MLYICTKFREIISEGIKIKSGYRADMISIWKITTGNNYTKNVDGVTILISARRLIMLCISTKFCEIILNGIKVIEPTLFLYGKLQRVLITQKM